MSEIRVTSVVGENGGDRVGLTTGLTVGPLTGTTGIGATITHQGHAQFAGVCTASSSTVSSGNVIIGTAGKGIDYSTQTTTSASGATATGEVLVHYEEGTWTPNLTTSNGGTYNASYRYGHYTRIGRMVHAHFVFNSYGAQLTDIRGSGSDNDVVLGSGLPFPTTNNGQEYYCSDMGFWAVNFPGSLSQGSMFMYAYINANSSEWSFWLPSDNAGGAQLKVQQFGQAYIRGCFHYLTS